MTTTKIARLPYLYDLVVWPFATYQKTFTYSTGTCVLDKVPVNLTGCTARLMVRRSPLDLSPMVSVSDVASAAGGILLGGVLGTLSLTFNPVSTGILLGEPGFALYVTMADGSVRPLVAGRVLVQPGYVH